MKKLTRLILGFFILFSAAYAEFEDVPSDHWAKEAVENLQDKDLFSPKFIQEKQFEGEKTLSRYEIAFMLYSNLKLTENEFSEKASAEDFEILKRLTYEFAPELQSLGGDVDFIKEKLSKLEKEVNENAKMKSRINNLEDYLKKVRFNGNIYAGQEAEYKDQLDGLEKMKYDAKFLFHIDPVENIDLKLRLRTYNLNHEQDEVELDKIEFRSKFKNANLTLFKDSEKKGMGFASPINIFSWEETKPEQGFIASGDTSFKKNSFGYKSVIAQNDDNDIYALETKAEFDYLNNKNIDNVFRIGYSEIISDYQNNDDEMNITKSLYSFSTRLSYDKFKWTNLNFEMEYASIKGPNIKELNREAKETGPLFGRTVKNNDALYLYTYGKIKRNTGISFAGGIYNSGEHFDISGLSDTDRKIFPETGLVKAQNDKQATMAKLKYDYKEKNKVWTEIIFANYGSNIKNNILASELRWLNTWNVLPGNKAKLQFEYKLEKDEINALNATTSEETLNTDSINEKGKVTYEAKSKFRVFPKRSEQNISFRYSYDKDKEDFEDREKHIRFYIDNETQINEVLYLKTALAYKKSGLDLENKAKYILKNGSWIRSYEYNEFYKSDNLELALGMEIKPKEKKIGTINFGAYMNYYDQKGGEDILTGEDVSKKYDETKFHIFAAHEYKRGNWTINYGLKYHIEKEAVINDTYDNYSLKDLDKSKGGLNDWSYAIGVEYKYTKDTLFALEYGDPNIKDDDEFMYDDLSFADGMQDRLTAKFQMKF